MHASHAMVLACTRCTGLRDLLQPPGTLTSSRPWIRLAADAGTDGAHACHDSNGFGGLLRCIYFHRGVHARTVCGGAAVRHARAALDAGGAGRGVMCWRSFVRGFRGAPRSFGLSCDGATPIIPMVNLWFSVQYLIVLWVSSLSFPIRVKGYRPMVNAQQTDSESQLRARLPSKLA